MSDYMTLEEARRRISSLEVELQQAQADVRKGAVNSAVAAAAKEAGCRPGAEGDLVRRAEKLDWRCDARGSWVLYEDNVCVYDRSARPITPKLWTLQMKNTDCAHLFGDAPPDVAPAGKAAAAGGPNPFAKATLNVGQQTAVFQRDPAEAERLAHAAGLPGLPPFLRVLKVRS